MLPSSDSYPHIRRKLALTLLLSVVTNVLAPLAFAHGNQSRFVVKDSSAAATQTDFIRQIPLTANDIVYDKTSQLLYASVPSSAGSNGNSITPVNPATGEVGTPVFVGSEPNQLALADDSQTLYVSLDGAYAIRRFDLSTRTPGAQLQLGREPSTGQYRANDIAVAPGNPNLIAVARYKPVDPPEGGVAVFDNFVQRAKTGPGHTQGSDFLAFSSSASTLYGTGPYLSALSIMTVDSSGVTVDGHTTFGVAPRIKFDNGLLYSGSGQVINMATRTLLGTFAGAFVDYPSRAFVPDSSVRRAFYLVSNGYGSTNRTFTLKAYDIDTFINVGSLTVSGINGEPTSLVRWGANGLAFRTTGNQLFIIQTSLIPSSTPVPTPTPTPSPSPTPSPTPPVATNVRQVPLPSNDIVFDSQTQKIYASVPSSVGSSGNSITPVDPVTGTMGTSVFIGSEPTKLAISDNGQYLYTALNGAGAVRRFDIASQSAGLQFSLGSDPTLGVLNANDIEVAPGHPETVAVATSLNADPSYHGGVTIYDDGVKRPATTPRLASNNQIEFSGSPSVLYGFNTRSSSHEVRKMLLDTCGIGIFNTISNPGFGGYNGNIEFDNGLLYDAGGNLFDPEAGIPIGRYVFFDDPFTLFIPLVLPDSKAGKVYFLTGNGSIARLQAFDIKTFLKVGTIDIPGVSLAPSSLIRWGTNGLAFRASGKIYAFETDLVTAPSTSTPPAPLPVARNFRVSGRVTEDGGVGVRDATVTLTGTRSATTQTDNNGNFSIDDIQMCGTYTIKVSHPNYIIDTSTRSIIPATGIDTVSDPRTIDGNILQNFNATAKSLQFYIPNYNVSEGAGFAVISVVRPYNTVAEAATVDYAVSDGTASQRTDYTFASGTLVFNPGQFSRSFFVLLTDNAFVDGNRTINLTLSNPTGAILGINSSSVLTIIDNDTTQPTTNPADNAQAFVRQQYTDFLNRAPDAGGLGYWSNEITKCGTDQQCINERRISVADAFFFEPEFQQTGAYIYRIFKAATGQMPTYPQFMADRGSVIAGQGLDSSKSSYALAFVKREAFLQLYQRTLSADQFVDTLLNSIKQNSGIDLTAQRSGLINLYDGTDIGRAAILRQVADAQAFIDGEYNNSFVQMLYFGYLRRDPETGGFGFWRSQLDKYLLRNVGIQHAMACSFITSTEYQTRFSSVITHSNRECPQ